MWRGECVCVWRGGGGGACVAGEGRQTKGVGGGGGGEKRKGDFIFSYQVSRIEKSDHTSVIDSKNSDGEPRKTDCAVFSACNFPPIVMDNRFYTLK